VVARSGVCGDIRENGLVWSPSAVLRMDPASWALAKEILADALDLAKPERADYVRMRCGDDGALAQAVLSLLSDPAATSAFLEAPRPADVPGQGVDGEPAIPEPPGRGSTSRRDTTARRELVSRWSRTP
jgi:hypothetical protein